MYDLMRSGRPDWANFTLGNLFLITQQPQIFGLLVSTKTVFYKKNFPKYALCCIIGDFFTNASGHPWMN
jgi:hypothetical protein